MKFLERIFHLQENKTSIKTEIIGGLMTFVAMCYILPVVASNLYHGAGMDKQGVFVVTAFLTAIIILVMALVAKYPIALSSGLGINAYIAFTLSSSFPSWHQRMILLTVCGLVFFVLSLTPVRKIIIESIPKDIKFIISAALGGFLFFVGLKNSGIIVSNASTLVSLGNFADPAVLIAILSIVVVLILMFGRNPLLKTLAIPFGILFAAIAGLIASLIMTTSGAVEVVDGVGIYRFGNLDGMVTNLPIAPWLLPNKFADITPAKEVLFFGLFSDSYGGSDFGNDLGAIFSNPISYVAIFSVVFINLFDTTAAYLSFNDKVQVINEEGKINNYHRTVLADSTGALLAGPFGTTTVEPLAESNVGISMGARTGLASVMTAFMFILSAFIYPVFSVFTAYSVTAPALAGIGILIMVNAVQSIDIKNPTILVTLLITFILSILCYSISDGIGFGLIVYCALMLVQGKGKEVSIPIYVIAGLFIVSFTVNAIISMF